MAGFKSRAQWERCEKLVKDGQMTQKEFDRYVSETGCPKHELPERLGKKKGG